MLAFESDYTAGAHPAVLEQLVRTNLEPLPGYGTDCYSLRAADRIRQACESPDAQVFFLTGGTQTNAIVIAAMLSPWQGAVAASTGHIHVHEAGAVEASGHKILTLPEHLGKIDPDELDAFVGSFYRDDNHEHMVYPGLVYLSHPTEYGTLYSRQELEQIAAICSQYDMHLFLDGARLGYGLASRETDVTLPDIASLCDAFYIGGTKVGALCGEAVVFAPGKAPAHFYTFTKQRGAMLAKGRLLGIQFDALFTDDLYMKISRHAIIMADRLRDLLHRKGYPFYLESPTNQQFVILTPEQQDRLRGLVRYSPWEALPDGRMVVRFAVSWSTTDEDMAALEAIL